MVCIFKKQKIVELWVNQSNNYFMDIPMNRSYTFLLKGMPLIMNLTQELWNFEHEHKI